MAAETIKQISQGGVVRDIEDATARTLIQSLQNALDFLTNGDTTSAIESFNEIISFLENVEDSSNLSGIIAGIQTSIAGKVDKVTGKGLSTNDFTTELMNKLIGIAAGATANQGTVTGIKVNNGNTQEPTDGVVNLEIETGGEDGVGIASAIQTTTSEVSGGDNVVTITLTDGTTSQITIKNGQQGAQGNSGYTGAANELEVVNNLEDGGATAALSAEMGKELAEQTLAGEGAFAKAYRKAIETNVPFPWILKDVDKNNNPITKMIWHVGNREFVDAIGGEVNWYKDGVTVIANERCVMTASNNINWNATTQLKNIVINVGLNVIPFSEIRLNANDTIGEIPCISFASATFETVGGEEVVTVDRTSQNVDITYLNLGGLKVKSRLWLYDNTHIEIVDGLYMAGGDVSSWTYWNKSCSKLKHISVIGGEISYSQYGQILAYSLSSLTKLDYSKLIAPTYSVTFNPVLEYLDIRGMNPKLDFKMVNGEKQYVTTFPNEIIRGNLALSTVIIGDFDTSEKTSAPSNYAFNVSNNKKYTLVCTTATPPATNPNGYGLKPANGEGTLLSNASKILVPEGSLLAYQSADIWSEYASIMETYPEGEY